MKPSQKYVLLEDFTASNDGNSGVRRPPRDRAPPRKHDKTHEIRSYPERLDTKDLPSPNIGGRIVLAVVHAIHNCHRWIRHRRPAWMHLGGWRQTVRAGAAVAVCVLIMNIIILIWGWAHPVDSFTGQRLLARGDCGQTKNITTYWHFAINVFSTLLLATSNAAMQCLSAPTREAVDRAHAEGTWVDIGISGLRNWRYMDRWRKWCWILLVVSTLPLHLLYNSVIFGTTTANEYWALAVSPSFLDEANFTIPDQSNFWTYDEDHIANLSMVNHVRSLATQGASMKRLEKDACIDTYSQTMLSQYSNVLLVAKSINISETSSLLRYYYHAPVPRNGYSGSGSFATNWICGKPDSLSQLSSKCDSSSLQADADNWNLTAALFDKNEYFASSGEYVDVDSKTIGWAPPIFVDYCLAEEVEPQCTVEFIPEIMVIVVIANIIKVVCFISTLKTASFKPLVTLGDCLASCLERPDPYTRHLGPLSALDVRQAIGRAKARDEMREIRHRRSRLTTRGERQDPLPGLPLELGPWKSARRRWFSGASRLRWALTYSLLISSWAVGLSLFLILVTVGGNASDFASQWSTGFGNVSPNFLVSDDRAITNLVSNSILANMPQLGLSLIYISLNGLWTCILLSREFTLFARRRDGLRVSEPSGRYQRSTPWLSLPYRFSIPLLVISWALHWSLSQTLFLAEVIVLSPLSEEDKAASVSTLGYSMLAWMIFIIFESIAIITPLLLGWIRYCEGSPLVESYSLAISAACHPTTGTDDHGSHLLKYGAIEEEYYNGEDITIDAGTAVPLAQDANRGNHSVMEPFLGNNNAEPTSPYPSFCSSPSFPKASLTSQDSTLGHSPGIEDLRSPSASTLAPRRNLIVTLSKGTVAPLIAAHTYTPKRALTSAEMSFRNDSLSHPTTRRWLAWLLLISNLAKAAILGVVIPYGPEVFISGLGMVISWNIFIWTVAGLGLLYLFVRFILLISRLRWETASTRRWWWHVVPDLGLGFCWLVIILGSIPTLDLSYSSVGFPLLIVLFLLYCFSGAAEQWLWSLANPGLTRAAISDLRKGRWKFPEFRRVRKI